MYADISRDQVNAFLSELTSQPEAGAVENVAEAFSDEMIIAQMELARMKACRAKGKPFVTRAAHLPLRARAHPADLN